MFTLPEYCAPDFSAPLLQNAPSVRTAPAPADGAAPAGYHATGMYPEYYKVDGVWRLAEKSRMDCVPVLAPDGELRIVEFRNLVQGDSVVLGRTDDGSEGILMHTEGFSAGGKSAEAFAFRTGRSRDIFVWSSFPDESRNDFLSTLRREPGVEIIGSPHEADIVDGGSYAAVRKLFSKHCPDWKSEAKRS